MTERSKPKPALLAGAVVVLAVLALAVWWLVGSSDSDDSSAEPQYTPATPAASSAAPSEPTTATPAPKVVTPKTAGPRSRPLTDEVRLAGGATAEVTKVERVRSEANLPGEVSAPALRFTVRATAGDEALDLSRVVVNAYYGPDRTPAIAITEPGGRPFEGSLRAGRSATGVFVFNVPPRERDRVQLEFSWSPKQRPVILTGDLS